ncbi:class I SAM-dependent methyltransferase [Janibacter cremeus]|uniref:class I SAM-dependent methyltransferase n=1 Tax=Janibacter cremeus TaxID=1285192 RepID=UPI0023F75F5B|nr:class I SAM-dependent methyltransferase [Janibacter cremeus]WEV78994.1 class I SAM-dependent methyltransferase [Janibacter cremeus]
MAGGATSSDVWTAEQAQHHDHIDARPAPEVVGPAVEALTALAGGGRALAFAIGTGRIAVPLVAKGVPFGGIELSAPMIEQLRTKVTSDELPVTIGDMAGDMARETPGQQE